jgi:lipopolysaccharide/colanic/teichoic acid biosynthesis glycosyltransferase
MILTTGHEDEGLFRPGTGGRRQAYWRGRRAVDLVLAMLFLPLLALAAGLLLLLNPLCNPGPLLFRQLRMGRGGRPFSMIKFRTMTPLRRERSAEEPLETDRITPLGYWLRRSRLDEMPQILNILRGEMSFIGPRPDCLAHARHFAQVIPHYHERYSVRPGLSGLAQIALGYTEGSDLARRKIALDLHYIRHASWMFDLKILWGTLLVVVTGRGAR